MAMKKWAMVIMNAGYDPEKDMARLDLEQVETHILTVRNPEEAVALAKRLGEEGFGAIEVCGAFGEELAKKMYEATGCKVPVGYVTTPRTSLRRPWHSGADGREQTDSRHRQIRRERNTYYEAV